ncbi:hypothetical protein Q4Q39_01685 [Flavivirga amylovorans]|uniref:Uncharacterized protein n=1 Tax=Flavivirga amylovorans TaxID=870486 RepID=A0ABT8WWP6_9FLAO|nr:hypothetical protein [Flavivirga amylovorans]MDO5986104.1 hypothetical protein [Flavivirga amylovorans]
MTIKHHLNIDKKEILLPKNLLDSFIGEYPALNNGIVTITENNGLLQIKADKMAVREEGKIVEEAVKNKLEINDYDLCLKQKTHNLVVGFLFLYFLMI